MGTLASVREVKVQKMAGECDVTPDLERRYQFWPAAIDLDLLDKRDFAPVGYRRYNKVRGETVTQQDIVKGYAYKKDAYVVLADADLRQANPESTQSIEILFRDARDIPPMCLSSL